MYVVGYFHVSSVLIQVRSVYRITKKGLPCLRLNRGSQEIHLLKD
jgi:hypothetical protein